MVLETSFCCRKSRTCRYGNRGANASAEGTGLGTMGCRRTEAVWRVPSSAPEGLDFGWLLLNSCVSDGNVKMDMWE